MGPQAAVLGGGSKPAARAAISARRNVLFLGPSGAGKSHLGVKALKNGFAFTHFVLDDLMHAQVLISSDTSERFYGSRFNQEVVRRPRAASN